MYVPADHPGVWFFDNDPSNFFTSAQSARLSSRADMLAALGTPRRCPAHTGVLPIPVPTPTAIPDPPPLNDLPGFSRIAHLTPESHWDRRAGLRGRHIRAYTPDRARWAGIREILFDWDGTLTCTEGVPTLGTHNLTDLAKACRQWPGPAFDYALACALFGGATRARRVGRYLEALHAQSGAFVRILTKNRVHDDILTGLLRAVAPGIPLAYWTAPGPHDYPGSLGPSYTRRHILHSDHKMATIAALTANH